MQGLEEGLLPGAAGLSGGAPMHRQRSTTEKLEDRGVTAAFLHHFTEEHVTLAVAKRATAAAIPYLAGMIREREAELQELEAGAGGRGRELRMVIGRRWLRWLQADLAKRKASPYLTARDVHRYIIKGLTDASMLRFCELAGVAEGFDSDTGAPHIGKAQHFFSYNWDSPWDEVVDAISTHSESMVSSGRTPPYYWVDNFAINQHYRTSDEVAELCHKMRAEPWLLAGGSSKRAAAGDKLETAAVSPGWGFAPMACPPCVACAAKISQFGWAMPCADCPCVACRASSEDMVRVTIPPPLPVGEPLWYSQIPKAHRVHT
jgi:hypothetical protein